MAARRAFLGALLLSCALLVGMGNLQAGREEASRDATLVVKPAGGPTKLPYYEAIIGATIMLPATNREYTIQARTSNYGTARYPRQLIWGRCFDSPQSEQLVFDRAIQFPKIPKLTIQNYSLSTTTAWSYALLDDTSKRPPIAFLRVNTPHSTSGLTKISFPSVAKVWNVKPWHHYVFEFEASSSPTLDCNGLYQ